MRMIVTGGPVFFSRPSFPRGDNAGKRYSGMANLGQATGGRTSLTASPAPAYRGPGLCKRGMCLADGFQGMQGGGGRSAGGQGAELRQQARSKSLSLTAFLFGGNGGRSSHGSEVRLFRAVFPTAT